MTHLKFRGHVVEKSRPTTPKDAVSAWKKAWENRTPMQEANIESYLDMNKKLAYCIEGTQILKK